MTGPQLLLQTNNYKSVLLPIRDQSCACSIHFQGNGLQLLICFAQHPLPFLICRQPSAAYLAAIININQKSHMYMSDSLKIVILLLLF